MINEMASKLDLQTKQILDLTYKIDQLTLLLDFQNKVIIFLAICVIVEFVIIIFLVFNKHLNGVIKNFKN